MEDYILKIEKLSNRYLIDWGKASKFGDGINLLKIEEEILNPETKRIYIIPGSRIYYSDFITNGRLFVEKSNLYYYKSIIHEEYIIKRIVEYFGKMPEFILDKEEWVRLEKIRRIIE